jgi:hypothetical protein
MLSAINDFITLLSGRQTAARRIFGKTVKNEETGTGYSVGIGIGNGHGANQLHG